MLGGVEVVVVDASRDVAVHTSLCHELEEQRHYNMIARTALSLERLGMI